MATLQLFISTDLLKEDPWNYQLTAATGSLVSVSGLGYAASFTGDFELSGPAVALPVGGIITAATQAKNGQTQVVLSSLDEPASLLNHIVGAAATPAGVYAYLLRGNDNLTGSASSDLLGGFGGDDLIDGGGGIDGAYYTGGRSEYGVTRTGTGFRVADLHGVDGVDTLVNIERLSFEDVSVAFDIDGNAGTVARFIGAVFGRAAMDNVDYEGIGLRLLDSGISREALMQVALDAKLGSLIGDPTQVVSLLFRNVVGTDPGPLQLAQFSGLLESGAETPVSLGLLAAENISLVGLAETGIAFV